MYYIYISGYTLRGPTVIIVDNVKGRFEISKTVY